MKECQRKYLKLNDGLRIRAIDSRTTGIYAYGRKFAEVVYKNDFLDDLSRAIPQSFSGVFR